MGSRSTSSWPTTGTRSRRRSRSLGGEPTTIATSAGTGKQDIRFEVWGDTVLAWTDRGNRTSTLTVWSAASGSAGRRRGPDSRNRTEPADVRRERVHDDRARRRAHPRGRCRAQLDAARRLGVRAFGAGPRDWNREGARARRRRIRSREVARARDRVVRGQRRRGWALGHGPVNGM